MIHPLCTARVLTTDLAAGATWREALAWDQSERDQIGEGLFRFVFRSLYRMKAFNGDPHPGNYLFHGDGRITFLDFGLVRYFSSDEIAVFAGLVKAAAVDHDAAAFRDLVERAGLLLPGAPVDTGEVGEYFSDFYAPVADDAPMTWTKEYASQIVRHTFDRDEPDRPVRHGAPRLRVHPADQSRPLRPARRSRRPGQLPPGRRGAVAVLRRSPGDDRWAWPSGRWLRTALTALVVTIRG